ncbi:MAG: hypothetical protein AAF615_06505 [Pseudomonadota bacterium]
MAERPAAHKNWRWDKRLGLKPPTLVRRRSSGVGEAIGQHVASYGARKHAPIEILTLPSDMDYHTQVKRSAECSV